MGVSFGCRSVLFLRLVAGVCVGCVAFLRATIVFFFLLLLLFFFICLGVSVILVAILADLDFDLAARQCLLHLQLDLLLLLLDLVHVLGLLLRETSLSHIERLLESSLRKGKTASHTCHSLW